jgi:hypothetical protein
MPTQVNSTYTTKVIPLLSVYDSREYNNNYDSLAFNLIPEIVKTVDGTEIHMVKRDGSEEIIPSISAVDVRGIFYWSGYNKIFVSIDTNIYIYNASNYALITTLAGAFASATSKVGFCSYLYEDGTSVVMCTDGTTLNKITSANAISSSASVVTTVGTHLPTPLYYDGYLLLVKNGTGDCYNSEVDDPTTWTPGNFITAEISPDIVTNISRINNYFILFGKSSIEYFYDVGNPTGTPFARNDVFVKLTGCNTESIVQHGNQLYLVGNKLNASPEVFMLEDFKLTSISTPAIRRWLLSAGITINGFIVSINGHDLYILQAPGSRCYYYDITSQLWGRLGWQSSSDDFPITNTLLTDTGVQTETVFTISGNNALYKFTPILYQDDGVNYKCILRTDPENFGTNNQKFMSSLVVWADRIPSVGSIDIQYTDNDYASYSTARTIILDHERPNAQQWGRFRTRAFKFTYTSDNPLRIRKIETDINIGIT